MAYPIQIRRTPGQPISTAEAASSSGSKGSSSSNVAAQSQAQASGGTNLSGGAIAGIVIGTVVGLAIIGLLIWITLMLRRRGRSSQELPELSADAHDGVEKKELSAEQNQDRHTSQLKTNGPALVELQGSEGVSRCLTQ